jgi:MFS family permease
MAWIPTFFIRTFGWSASFVGLRFGLMLLIFGTAGILFGGYLSGWLRNRGKADANLLVGIISASLVLPAGMIAPIITNESLCFAAFCGFVFAGSMPYGAAAAAFQEITPNQMRAQVTAIYFLFLNLAGIGLGPTVVALLTDQVFQDDFAVKYSLVVLAAIGAPLSALLLWRGRRPYRECLAEGSAKGIEAGQ